MELPAPHTGVMRRDGKRPIRVKDKRVIGTKGTISTSSLSADSSGSGRNQAMERKRAALRLTLLWLEHFYSGPCATPPAVAHLCSR
jgi:hypothetical protein